MFGRLTKGEKGKRDAERRRKQAERVRKYASKLLREKKKEEYETTAAERRLKRVEAQTRVAEAEARKKDAERRKALARREKWGAILKPPKVSLPRISSGDKKRVGKAAKSTGRGLAKGFKGLQEWARSGREREGTGLEGIRSFGYEPARPSKPARKRSTTKKKTTKKRS